MGDERLRSDVITQVSHMKVKVPRNPKQRVEVLTEHPLDEKDKFLRDVVVERPTEIRKRKIQSPAVSKTHSTVAPSDEENTHVTEDCTNPRCKSKDTKQSPHSEQNSKGTSKGEISQTMPRKKLDVLSSSSAEQQQQQTQGSARTKSEGIRQLGNNNKVVSKVKSPSKKPTPETSKTATALPKGNGDETSTEMEPQTTGGIKRKRPCDGDDVVNVEASSSSSSYSEKKKKKLQRPSTSKRQIANKNVAERPIERELNQTDDNGANAVPTNCGGKSDIHAFSGVFTVLKGDCYCGNHRIYPEEGISQKRQGLFLKQQQGSRVFVDLKGCCFGCCNHTEKELSPEAQDHRISVRNDGHDKGTVATARVSSDGAKEGILVNAEGCCFGCYARPETQGPAKKPSFAPGTLPQRSFAISIPEQKHSVSCWCCENNGDDDKLPAGNQTGIELCPRFPSQKDDGVISFERDFEITDVTTDSFDASGDRFIPDFTFSCHQNRHGAAPCSNSIAGANATFSTGSKRSDSCETVSAGQARSASANKAIKKSCFLRKNPDLLVFPQVQHIPPRPGEPPYPPGIEIQSEDRRKFVQQTVLSMWECPPSVQHCPVPNPCSLERKDFQVLSGREYVVAEKSDGVRYLMLLCRYGQGLLGSGRECAVMIDRKWKCYEVEIAAGSNYFDGTLLDGELVWEWNRREREWDLCFLVFDIVYSEGASTKRLDYGERVTEIENALIESPGRVQIDCPPGYRSKFSIRKKMIYPSRNMDLLLKSIPQQHHANDGLIFMPIEEPVGVGTQTGIFKYKQHHTIDLRVTNFNMTRPGPPLSAPFPASPKDQLSGFHVYWFDLERNDEIEGPLPNGWQLILTPCPFFQNLIEYHRSAGLTHMNLIGEFECDIDQDRQLANCRMVHIRPDKPFPNNGITIARTLYNIIEDIQVPELLHVFCNQR